MVVGHIGLMEFGVAWINSMWQAFPHKAPAEKGHSVCAGNPGSSPWDFHIVSDILVLEQSQIIPSESLAAWRV